MENSIVSREDLAIGMMVEINPRDDRSRKIRVSGELTEVLTNASTHSHGILVKLMSGEIGRVKKILSSNAIESKSNSIKELDNLTVASSEELITNGENHFVEFKSSMLWSERLTPEQISSNKSKHVSKYGRNASKVIVAHTVCGFLNADGGDLFIGIKENKESKDDEIIGVESEYSKLKDACDDGYRRKIIDSIIKLFFPSFIFNHFNTYLNISFVTIDNNKVCRINISKSDQKVFLNINNEEMFFVRVDASTRQLHGEEIVDYCMKRFNK